MKSFYPVLIIAAFFAIAIFARKSKTYSRWLESNTAFLASLNIIGVIGLIASLSMTIWQFNITQDKQQKEQIREFKARISVLESELLINAHICKKEFLGLHDKRKEVKALSVPESRFEIAILEQALSSGDIVDDDSRMLLWNLYRLMSITNSLLDHAINVRHTEHIADPRDLMLIQGRRSEVNTLVRNAMARAAKVEKLLDESIKWVALQKKA